jgi:poly(3-hydroxybutyrate) depolymerase
VQPNRANLTGKLSSFSQDAYTQAKWELDADMLSMDTTGFVYTPAQCSNQSVVCDVMLLLHGCEQSHSIVGSALIEQAFMNEYADTNNIVVIYPQTIALEEGLVLNPKACWDWWSVHLH